MHHDPPKVFKPARFFGPVFLLAALLPAPLMANAQEAFHYTCTVPKVRQFKGLSKKDLPEPWVYSFSVFPQGNVAMVTDPLTHQEFGRAVPAQISLNDGERFRIEWELFSLRGRGGLTGRGWFSANILRAKGAFVLEFSNGTGLGLFREGRVFGKCTVKQE
ncbi:hypothetical protein OEZ49_09565 [Ruegeria sp. WL0004]|uniref:Uncharacterized protein n=1 Tax=Ruegeria marisflavi TaxID=2984152 RepID=A0ABT2WQR6_9RHOB|nr:hypothetical protein [Ruegeria sp. WL0004]MCU9838012.1 hypothetical protein [Ruegeria sp. WL0004]